MTHFLEKYSTFWSHFIKGAPLFDPHFLITIYPSSEGASLFDSLFGKVLHFLESLLKGAPLFDAPII